MIVHINKLSQGQSQSMGEVTSALNKTEEAILQIDELSHRLATVSEELNVKASDIEGTTRRLMATDS
jgi:DNA repair ATPase RecN